MDFIDEIRALAANIPKHAERIQTEEATKNAWVMPFIRALGYNVFDPTEVVPEFTADVGLKKGEKVDYAIFKDGTPTMLIECKCNGCDLDTVHASQLFRYFTVTQARFGVLTNGIVYRFYTDLEEPNKMDSKPFLEFNMLDIREPLVEQLKKFTKSAFDMDQILATASELKYTTEIKRLLAEQLASPSEEFVRLFTSKVYSGRLTQAVREQFAEITRRAFQQFISDRISDRLKSALAEETDAASDEASPSAAKPTPADQGEAGNGVVTTSEEREAYLVVKSILREAVDARRVFMRDAKTYCTVLLDDSNRKPICRLWFNGSRKYVGFIDAQKQEQREAIDDMDDIFQYADRLKATVRYYEGA